MQRLREIVSSHQRELRDHRLFQVIETNDSVESLAHLARSISWWPMVFQDVLRLNLEKVRGTPFERFAEYHRREDAGHERWFLDDLQTFGQDSPALEELFGSQHHPVRDACYEIMSEVYRHQSGAERIALLLALEATGHVFFEQIAAAIDRVCPELPLRYFAHSHLTVEKAHDLFTEATEADLAKILLTDVERHQSEAMVQRVFRTFHDIFSFLADGMVEHRRSQSHIRELVGTSPEARGERHAGSS